MKGEGNSQDYGMRISDPRLGRFLSVDPLTQKFAMLTPYQYASNRPIDGIDLDGLEYVKYDKNATSLIIYNRTRDNTMEAEYQAALKSKMNVMVAYGVDEANKYLAEKGTKYQRIISSGHGGTKGNSILVAGAGYQPKDIKDWEKEFLEFREYVNEGGMIVSLACYNTTPDQNYKVYTSGNPNGGTERWIDRMTPATQLASQTGRSFFGSDSEVRTGYDVFNEGELKAGEIRLDSEYDLHKKTHNTWRLISPTGAMETLKDVKMKSDGSMYGKVTTSSLQKLLNKVIGYYKKNQEDSKQQNNEKKPK